MSQFQRKDDRFEQQVRDSFSRQRAVQTLGIEIARLAPGEIMARANSADAESLLQQATSAARELGIFGAPTFTSAKSSLLGR